MKKHVILLSLVVSANLFAGVVSEMNNSWLSIRDDYKNKGFSTEEKAGLARMVLEMQIEEIEKAISDDSSGKSFEVQQSFDGVDLITDNIDGDAGLEMLENLEERRPEMCAALADFMGSNIKNKLIKEYAFIMPDTAAESSRIINQYIQSFKIGCENGLKLKKMLAGEKAAPLNCGAEVSIPLAIHSKMLVHDTALATKEISDLHEKNKLSPKTGSTQSELGDLTTKLNELRTEGAKMHIEMYAQRLISNLHQNKLLCDAQADLLTTVIKE